MNNLINLDNYKLFYEVAKCGNITKASEKLFISQPAISQTIKKMEDRLGVKLFIRSKKGIELTTIGKKIFQEVEFSLHNISNIEQLINEEKGLLKGEIVIGGGSNITRKILTMPIAQFLLDYPLINFKIIESVQSEMINQLRTGELHFVLTQYNEDIKFPFIPLFKTNYCFIESPNKETEKFLTTHEGSFVHKLMENFLDSKNYKKSDIMQIAGYKTSIELVKHGVGTTLVPYYLAEEDLNNKKLIKVYTDYELPSIQFGIYYNPNLLMPASKIFMEYLND